MKTRRVIPEAIGDALIPDDEAKSLDDTDDFERQLPISRRRHPDTEQDSVDDDPVIFDDSDNELDDFWVHFCVHFCRPDLSWASDQLPANNYANQGMTMCPTQWVKR